MGIFQCHCGPVVPCNVLHGAWADGGLVHIVNKLTPNISGAVRYREIVTADVLPAEMCHLLNIR